MGKGEKWTPRFAKFKPPTSRKADRKKYQERATRDQRNRRKVSNSTGKSGKKWKKDNEREEEGSRKHLSVREESYAQGPAHRSAVHPWPPGLSNTLA